MGTLLADENMKGLGLWYDLMIRARSIKAHFFSSKTIYCLFSPPFLSPSPFHPPFSLLPLLTLRSRSPPSPPIPLFSLLFLSLPTPGGYGYVFIAQDVQTGAVYALKVIPLVNHFLLLRHHTMSCHILHLSGCPLTPSFH